MVCALFWSEHWQRCTAAQFHGRPAPCPSGSGLEANPRSRWYALERRHGRVCGGRLSCDAHWRIDCTELSRARGRAYGLGQRRGPRCGEGTVVSVRHRWALEPIVQVGGVAWRLLLGTRGIGHRPLRVTRCGLCRTVVWSRDSQCVCCLDCFVGLGHANQEARAFVCVGDPRDLTLTLRLPRMGSPILVATTRATSRRVAARVLAALPDLQAQWAIVRIVRRRHARGSMAALG